MARPREVILQALKAQLETITAANGYTVTVRTVSIGYELPTSRNRSEYPLILFAPLDDSDLRETEGNQSGNRYHRRWNVAVRFSAYPSVPRTDLREQGEILLADLIKCLVQSKDLGNKVYGVSVILDRFYDLDDFEADQSGLVHVGVDLIIQYAFQPQQL